jgi:hypothetical protein
MASDYEGTVVTERASEPFVGQWNRLISTTNWEKGRIVYQWRAALRESGAEVTEYSDETWSRLVGGVTSQHVGRLRRVFERFAEIRGQFDRLYWSHFQAAIDWDDAEMWLEGATQNGWSVALMRRQRWQTMSELGEPAPADDEGVLGELDEDFVPDERTSEAESRADRDRMADGYTAEVRSPAGPDFGDEDDFAGSSAERANDAPRSVALDPSLDGSDGEPFRPFADLRPLPDDLSSAFEAFQLAILHHKSQHWAEVSCDDVLASLDALKALAMAPA